MQPPPEMSAPIGLVLADPALASAFAGTAAAQGFALRVDPALPLQLRQDGRTLALQRGQSRLAGFAFPVRLGAVLDALRQAGRQLPPLALTGGLRLDVLARRLDLPGGTGVPLTEKEVEILAYLAAHARAAAPAPRAVLMQAVWGYSPEADTHTLETHVYRLRQKLEGAGAPALLLTGEGGYHLAQD